MHQWTGSSLVQVIACGLFGTKPLSAQMLNNCQWDHQNQTSVKLWLNLRKFHSRKCIRKCLLQNVSHFASASTCFCVFLLFGIHMILPQMSQIFIQGQIFYLKYWSFLRKKSLRIMICMHFREQNEKCQNGPENQMISKLCLENRNFFQTACAKPF